MSSPFYLKIEIFTSLRGIFSKKKRICVLKSNILLRDRSGGGSTTRRSGIQSLHQNSSNEQTSSSGGGQYKPAKGHGKGTTGDNDNDGENIVTKDLAQLLGVEGKSVNVGFGIGVVPVIYLILLGIAAVH